MVAPVLLESIHVDGWLHVLQPLEQRLVFSVNALYPMPPLRVIHAVLAGVDLWPLRVNSPLVSLQNIGQLPEEQRVLVQYGSAALLLQPRSFRVRATWPARIACIDPWLDGLQVLCM